MEISLEVLNFNLHPEESGWYIVWYVPKNESQRFVRLLEYDRESGKWFDQTEDFYYEFEHAKYMSLIMFPDVKWTGLDTK